jgi:hypothetical protein
MEPQEKHLSGQLELCRNLEDVLDDRGEGIILDCDEEEAVALAHKYHHKHPGYRLTTDIPLVIRYTTFSIDTLEQENWHTRV